MLEQSSEWTSRSLIICQLNLSSVTNRSLTDVYFYWCGHQCLKNVHLRRIVDVFLYLLGMNLSILTQKHPLKCEPAWFALESALSSSPSHCFEISLVNWYPCFSFGGFLCFFFLCQKSLLPPVRPICLFYAQSFGPVRDGTRRGIVLEVKPPKLRSCRSFIWRWDSGGKLLE